MTLAAINPADLLWSETLPAGTHTSFRMRRGNRLRLTDSEGGANLSALFINDDERSERYNMADTLKAQHTFHLTEGFVCYSDMGRVLCSLTADTLGWHDTVCGVSDAAQVLAKYGTANYQSHRNAMYRNGRDSLLIELEKWGLGKRDLVANVNFFSKIAADVDGNLKFQSGHSVADSQVELRFEMNTLVVLSSCPHPLDPNPHYQPKPVLLQAYRGALPDQDDKCRNFRPENGRGFSNTERYFL
ncbi:urea amidolyase associated protein UAAP1 [Methylomonas koyamae]|uniref:urea amidolyase associated protein UAAP1 n=1 Tax=Methylomonas koyamae TaxID=702114 RepID=UPI001C31EEF7|nr:urea amidolyase associated protein UAAP1 [Methylomonas koyamae]BBL59887.1 urea carboxylase [Methylomonas koyamae]